MSTSGGAFTNTPRARAPGLQSSGIDLVFAPAFAPRRPARAAVVATLQLLDVGAFADGAPDLREQQVVFAEPHVAAVGLTSTARPPREEGSRSRAGCANDRPCESMGLREARAFLLHTHRSREAERLSLRLGERFWPLTAEERSSIDAFLDFHRGRLKALPDASGASRPIAWCTPYHARIFSMVQRPATTG